MKWISVKDRLPEYDKDVLVCEKWNEHDEPRLSVMQLLDKISTRQGVSTDWKGWEWTSSSITHWMPLPEPPTE